MLSLSLPQRALLLVSRSEHPAVTFVQNFLAFLLVIFSINFPATVLLLLEQRSHRVVQSTSAGLCGRRRDGGGGGSDGGCGGGCGDRGTLFGFTLFTVSVCVPISLILTLSTVHRFLPTRIFFTFLTHLRTFLGNLRVCALFASLEKSSFSFFFSPLTLQVGFLRSRIGLLYGWRLGRNSALSFRLLNYFIDKLFIVKNLLILNILYLSEQMDDSHSILKRVVWTPLEKSPGFGFQFLPGWP